ncbi:MAG: glycosyltransferase family 2 protein [Planctomycetes bacterium]|nr:glycosyltransferase family 2 protein [Planctomycetota bacterium]
MKLSVVMPCYNEKGTIEQILERVAATPYEKEIIVVDDGSKDGTRDLLRQLEPKYGLKLIFHEQNKGKGGALATGFKAATGDVVLIQDADLEYDPADYPALLKPIEEGKADVVFGSRFLAGTHRCHRFWHYVGNKFLTFVSNVFTNLNLTDMETCYKVFRADVAKKIDIESQRFGVEPELTAKVAKLKCRVYEVPVSYYGRDYASGKKIRPSDAFEALWVIVKYNLFR